MDEFALSLLGCLAATLLLVYAGAATVPFAIALFAMSQIGYFSFRQLKKAGLQSPYAAMVMLAFSLGSFLVAFLASKSSVLIFSLSYIPLLFCLPAIIAVGREFYLSGDKNA